MSKSRQNTVRKMLLAYAVSNLFMGPSFMCCQVTAFPLASSGAKQQQTASVDFRFKSRFSVLWLFLNLSSAKIATRIRWAQPLESFPPSPLRTQLRTGFLICFSFFKISLKTSCKNSATERNRMTSFGTPTDISATNRTCGAFYWESVSTLPTFFNRSVLLFCYCSLWGVQAWIKAPSSQIFNICRLEFMR